MSGQGKMLASRSRTSYGGRIADHAVERFRERWPEGGHLTDEEVRRLIQTQVEAALKEESWVDAPGGRFVRFTFMGEEGYAVVAADSNVTTLLFEEWCPSITRSIEKKGRRSP